jgi:hypothetical protein
MSVLSDRIAPSTDSVEGRVADINYLDAPARARWPEGFIRAPFEGEAELVGVPEMLGVIVISDDDGQLQQRIPLLSWSYLVEVYMASGAEMPFTAAELAECVGTTLRELGVVRAVPS